MIIKIGRKWIILWNRKKEHEKYLTWWKEYKKENYNLLDVTPNDTENKQGNNKS